MYRFAKQHLAWILLGCVSIISVALWFMTLSGDVMSMYQFFPILGVLAWTTMWTYYIMGVISVSRISKQYIKWTGRFILLLILMHPGIFLVQRFLDTGLLPPESYVTYVGPLRVWAVALAFAALATFLLYDILKGFRHKLTAKGLWPYVSLLQALAMVAIFIHSLALGTNMYSSTFFMWWISLGVVLAPCLVMQVIRDFQTLPRK